MKTEIIAALIVLGGLAAIVGGCWFVSRPLALIVVGLWLVFWGHAINAAGKRRRLDAQTSDRREFD